MTSPERRRSPSFLFRALFILSACYAIAARGVAVLLGGSAVCGVVADVAGLRLVMDLGGAVVYLS